MGDLIITVAGVGAETSKEAQPNLPVSAEEIGVDAARCREAGACIYHLHVRRPDGTPTQDREVFAAAIGEIRKRSDIIIQASTGGAMGMTADERLQPLELRPEFEIFEQGQIDNALRLVKESGPAGPLMHWDFVLGVPGSMSGEPRNLVYLVDSIPREGSTWTCTGIGRWHMPVTMTALALGGNVRLGFEDNIFLHRKVLADGNAQLVERVVRLAREWSREPATPDEARQMLRLGERVTA
jgi:3-keto-5-aminohexanoate cleavage enzyme